MYGATTTATYIAERPAAPSPRTVTNTAPGTQLARALAMANLSPRPTDRLWGALPVEETEGHAVDPAYDVRPIEGLGRAPLRSERLSGLGAMLTEQDRAELERQKDLELRALARPTSVVQAAAGGGPTTPQAPSSASAPAAMGAGGVDVVSLLPLAALAGVLFLMRR